MSVLRAVLCSCSLLLLTASLGAAAPARFAAAPAAIPDRSNPAVGITPHSVLSSTVSLGASPTSPTYGGVVTLTATVTPGATGKVTFYDSVKVLGIATVTSGQAVLRTPMLPSGTRALRAHYSGDATYAASDSARLALAVAPVASGGLKSPVAAGALWTQPVQMVVDDLNGDGKMDVVAIDNTHPIVTVSLGNGDGTFQARAGYFLTSGAIYVATGDFNGDGKTDIAVATYLGINILLGNGDGTFQTATNTSLPNTPIRMLVADFNSDGKLDVAVIDAFGLRILTGNGDASFQLPVLVTSSYPLASAVADLNGDGSPDIVGSLSGGIVTVMLGNGDGTFKPAVSYSTYFGNLGSFQTGDFNADGKLDVVAISSNGGSLVVLPGNGDGTLSTPLYSNSLSSGFILAAADFDGDGVLDIASGVTSRPLLLAKGSGNGRFDFPFGLTFTGGPAAAIGDFNGDGKLDAVVATSAGFSLMAGGAIADLTISCAHSRQFSRGQTGAAYVLTVSNVGDVPARAPVTVVDALPAGLTATSLWGTSWACTLATLTCTYPDPLDPGASYPPLTVTVNVAANAPANLTNRATVSVAGDGNPANDSAADPTVILTLTATVTTLSSSANPSNLAQPVTFTVGVTPAISGKAVLFDGAAAIGTAIVTGGVGTITPSQLATGDHQLRAQFIGGTTYASSSSAMLTQSVNPASSAGFRPYVTIPQGEFAYEIIHGDFNGDGKQDMAAVGAGYDPIRGQYCCAVRVLLGRGDGTFQPIVTNTSSAAYSLAADFNLDGKLDLLVIDLTGNLRFLAGNGDGTFRAEAVAGAAGLNSQTSITGVVADFDGDGIPDIALRSSNAVSIMLGNGDGTFQPPIVTDVPDNSFIAAGDFNHDGVADLVVGGLSPGIKILIGKGNGTFQSPVSYASPYNAPAGSFVVADLNGDGVLDIVTVTDGPVIAYLGNGDGTFKAAVVSRGVDSASRLVVGDFNGDGKPDVAIFCRTASWSVFFLLGNGDGSFRFASSARTGGLVQDLTMADFDGDGTLDIATVGVESLSQVPSVSMIRGGIPSVMMAFLLDGGRRLHPGQTGVQYHLSLDNYSFETATGPVTVTYTLPPGFTATAIGGMGWVCSLATAQCTRVEGVEKGTGYGLLWVTVSISPLITPGTAIVQATITSNTATVNLTDVTVVTRPSTSSIAASPTTAGPGDSVTLTATVTAGATGNVTFLDGGSTLGTVPLTGTHAVLATRLVSAGVHSLRAVYAGDGAYSGSRSTAVTVTISGATETGLTLPTTYPAGTGPVALALGDFNRDGKLDMAVANLDSNSVSILYGNGSGGFGAKVDYAVGANPADIAVADLNGDGFPDVVVANSNGGSVSVLLGTAAGTFQPAVAYPANLAPQSIVVADFDGDGKPDLVVAGCQGVSILKGHGDGTFQPPLLEIPTGRTGGWPAGVVLRGDLNGDGVPDLVHVFRMGSAGVYFGNGDGTFVAGNSVAVQNVTLAAAAVADMDGDEKQDLIMAGGTSVYVCRGNGDGTFQTCVEYTAGSNVLSVAVGDFNGDGKLDVVAANSDSNNISIFMGNGDGTLQSPVSYSAGAGPSSVAVGDFNGDGKADIAVANYASNNVSVLLGTSQQALTAQVSHANSFSLGQSGASYSIVVSNSGQSPTSGTVSVAGALPASLTATAISGSGWSCTLQTLSCTRNDSLAAGGSFSAITVTVNVAFDAPAQVTFQVTASGGGSGSTSASDVTTINASPHTVSVTPASGRSLSQTFTFSYIDAVSVSNLTAAYASITDGQKFCLVQADPARRLLYLLNDGATAWLGPLTAGTAGALQNSQCTVDGLGSAVSVSGNQTALILALTFKAAFVGSKNVTGYAQSASGLNSGWVSLGTWTVPSVAPQVVSVSPSSGSGANQTFTFAYSDAAGGADLASAYVSINNGVTACMVQADLAQGRLYLYNDAQTAWLGPITLGSSTTVQNSQCSVSGTGSAVSAFGTQATLSLAMAFKPAFAGPKNVFGYVQTVGGLNSGWNLLGTWTATGAGPQVVSLAPSSGSGASQTFTLVYSDLAGGANIASAYVSVNNGVTACMVQADLVLGRLYLYNDSQTAWLGPIAMGTSSTVQNTQCTLSGTNSGVAVSGTQATVRLTLFFNPAFAGAKNVFGYVQSAGGLNSGWVPLGTWTVPSAAQPPQTVSVAPSSGSGTSQTFSFVYSDPNGGTDVARGYASINNGVTGCQIQADLVHGALYLLNDAQTGWLGPITAGTSSSVQNSQCTVNGSGSAVGVSGNQATLILALVFKPAFAGPKNVFGFAQDSGGLTSGWVSLGTWTVPGTTPPQAVSVVPVSGSGLAQTFSFVYSDVSGGADLTAGYASINNGESACMVQADLVHGLLYLLNDAMTAWTGPIAAGTSATLQNSQCTLNGSGSAKAVSGNQVTLSLALTFKAAFAGPKNVFGYAVTAEGLNSGWISLGTWTVQ